MAPPLKSSASTFNYIDSARAFDYLIQEARSRRCQPRSVLCARSGRWCLSAVTALFLRDRSASHMGRVKSGAPRSGAKSACQGAIRVMPPPLFPRIISPALGGVADAVSCGGLAKGSSSPIFDRVVPRWALQTHMSLAVAFVSASLLCKID